MVISREFMAIGRHLACPSSALFRPPEPRLFGGVCPRPLTLREPHTSRSAMRVRGRTASPHQTVRYAVAQGRLGSSLLAEVQRVLCTASAVPYPQGTNPQSQQRQASRPRHFRQLAVGQRANRV